MSMYPSPYCKLRLTIFDSTQPYWGASLCLHVSLKSGKATGHEMAPLRVKSRVFMRVSGLQRNGFLLSKWAKTLIFLEKMRVPQDGTLGSKFFNYFL